MKFEWIFEYVPEGQMTPDEHNRWLLRCSIMVDVAKCFPEYQQMISDGHLPAVYGVPVAWINQKGCAGASVPSTIDKFCASIPSTQWNPLDLGFGMSNFFSNDIEDLKRQVEEQYIRTRNMFINCI